MSTATPPPPWKAPDPLPNRLETDRLVIRYYESADAEGMFEAVDGSRDTLLPWLPWARNDDLDVAQCTFQIEKSRRDRAQAEPNDFMLGTFDKLTGVQVGGAGLHAVSARNQTAEIGYWTRVDRRGEGLCTEATRALVTWGFQPQADGGFGLRRIYIRCAGTNASSRRVPEKLGLRQEGCFKSWEWLQGEGWIDMIFYAVLADEWTG